MAELKTKMNDASVEEFLQSIENEQREKDSLIVLDMMKKISKSQPRMWGNSIIGFGNYHYKYASGREGDWFLTGFSPRKNALTLYLTCGFEPFDYLLKKLGKYKIGKGCLYIKKIEDVDVEVLQDLIIQSIKYLKEK